MTHDQDQVAALAARLMPHICPHSVFDRRELAEGVARLLLTAGRLS